MYFWNTKALRDDLLSGAVSQKKQMHYFLATMILYVLGGQSGSGYLDGTYEVIEISALLAVTIIGVLICYKANALSGNEDFIARFTCLSWPVTIKIVALIIISTIFLVLLDQSMFSTQEDSRSSNDVFEIIIMLIFEAIYFWRISVHLRFVKSELS